MRPSRREFVKWVTASGIALSMSRLGSAEPARVFGLRTTLPGREKWNPAANGAGRIDGVAKITGAKLYASDFAPPICRDGRPRHRTRFSSALPTQRTSTPAWISRVSAGR